MLPRTSRATDVMLPSSLPPRGEGAILVCDDDSSIRTVVSEHLTRQATPSSKPSPVNRPSSSPPSTTSKPSSSTSTCPVSVVWETLRRLRNNPVTANIPVVVLSVLSSTLRPQLTGDAQGWVQKPFNENLLFAELGRVLHHGDGPAYVLLVEDDEDLASVLTASFQDAAVRIDHASSRQQAIRQCITRPPDLLILDLTLPDGDGFSLVEWLRQQPTLRTLPLVVYSGREISEIEMAKLRLGPTEFLTKAKVQPQEVEELVLSMVHRIRTKFADLATAGPSA